MKIKVIKIGRPTFKEYGILVEQYQKRLRPFVKIEPVQVRARAGIEKSKDALFGLLGLGTDQASKKIDDVIVSLDEHGKLLSSLDLAGEMAKWEDDPRIKCVHFVVGGPYGLPRELMTASDMVWSLSPAVLPSDMAWLIVWEQIYRAYAINRGIAYHHA